MTSLIKAPFAPLINLGVPVYYLCTGTGPKKPHLERLTLAILRTATAAALFFTIIPFNIIFGHKDNLSGSLAFASQIIIHPYAACLFHAFINGGFLLLLKTTDLVSKRQLILTRHDAGSFARALGFLYVAYYLKNIDQNHWLDCKYRGWAHQLAVKLTT
jgi:hypothetical protein